LRTELALYKVCGRPAPRPAGADRSGFDRQDSDRLFLADHDIEHSKPKKPV
jgi:hypothetical protein